MFKIAFFLIVSFLFNYDTKTSELCNSVTYYAGYCLNGQTGKTLLACRSYNPAVLECTGCTKGCPSIVIEVIEEAQG